MPQPTKNEWEERFDYEFEGLKLHDRLKAFIRAEKEKSEAETLKKVLEVVAERKAMFSRLEADAKATNDINAVFTTRGALFALSDLTDKLTHLNQ